MVNELISCQQFDYNNITLLLFYIIIATCTSDLESLLQTIVTWAELTIPQSFSSILSGLLQDDVDSPLLGFLRLVFFKLLTEQDDCLVRALTACNNIHQVMISERSEVNDIHRHWLVY